MNLNNRALALRFAREAGINEPSSQKLQRFLELCAEHFLNVGSEMMRKRCANSCIDRSIGTDPDDFDEWDQCNYSCAEAIRALPVVTMEDLK